MAVIPGGTLNHFAGRLGIPTTAPDALDFALNGRAVTIDAGYVNGRLFINTSSVGAYTTFVRNRRYLEHRMNYIAASIVAGIRRFTRFRSIRLILGGKQIRMPLVFMGVGEREVRFPALGQVRHQGRKNLHVIAVDCTSRLEMLRLAFASILLSIDPFGQQRNVGSQLFDSFELDFQRRRRRVQVALDGELVWFRSPLEYRFVSNHVKLLNKLQNISIPLMRILNVSYMLNEQMLHVG